MTYTCMRQRPGGAWFYAEQPKYNWIDNFHTGYILSALSVYSTALQDDSFEKQLERGTEYFVTHFFEQDGRPQVPPRPHDAGRHPVRRPGDRDPLDTIGTYPDCLALAKKVAEWTIEHMQAPDGHFCYRDLGWTRVSTPMLHWGQGTMVKALAVALDKVAGGA